MRLHALSSNNLGASALCVKLAILSFGLIALSTGCATTPISTTAPAIVADPGQFRNEYIAITASVIENPPPRGDRYRTWSFTIGEPGAYRIVVTEEGFNPSTIDKAYRLVEDARSAGEQVTITGKLRVGPYHELESGIEIELVSVRYLDSEISSDKGPFVGGAYYPYSYRGPIFLHFGYYQRHHHGRWR